MDSIIYELANVGLTILLIVVLAWIITWVGERL